MKKSTEELLHTLQHSVSLSDYLKYEQENLASLSLPEALHALLTSKSLGKSDCIKNSGLDRTYCYQIFNGTKTPSRDKLLALCIGMGLSLEEVQTLLNQTGYAPLYPRRQRDSVILFGLSHGLDVCEVNDLLYELSMELLM